MLPIDEHAKSGAWVYCTNGTRQELKKVRWQGGSWVSASGFGGAPEEAYSYYLPVPLVENAAKMREALLSVSQCIYSNDYAEPALTTDFDQGKLDEVLYATEWPEKEAK